MDYYDKISKTYSELYGEEQKQKYVFIANLIKIQGKVLDVGCGDCQFASHFDVDYYGVEPAKELVRNSKYSIYFDKKRIQLVNAEDMKLDKMFDVIVCITSAHHFSDPDKVFSKLNNHLKKEGHLVVTLLKNSSKNTTIKEILIKYFTLKEFDQGKDVVFLCSSKL